jgi:hypothetical protein
MPPAVLVAAGVVLALIAGLFLFDRLMLLMERKGWIYWRRTKPGRGAAGSAFLEVQSLLEPDKRYVLEMRREEEASVEERSDQGDGEPPGGRPASGG